MFLKYIFFAFCAIISLHCIGGQLILPLPLLGGDDHDKKPHHQPILGVDDHDFQLHHKTRLGTDDHDRKPHHKPLLGGDDHDLKPHHKPLLGTDDHDKKPHYKPLLGGDDHDKKPHHQPILGVDDHDFQPHHKTRLGIDDHDRKPHHRPLLGGDDHDLKPHHKPLLGTDDHDLKPHHKPLLGADWHTLKPHNKFRGRKLLKVSHMEAFAYFVKAYNRNYTNDKEYNKRFRIFRNNLRKMAALQQNEMGTAEYGLTKFADWSLFEFRRLLGLRPHLKPSPSHLKPAQIPDIETPVEFDWRPKGVVTGVKNQGMCGSCWAFSVTGNVEGQWALKHKKLYSLSEQELVDCDDTDEGCNGGLPENAYKAIEDLGGLETEKAYPYEGVDDKCHLNKEKIKVRVNGSVELPEDEDVMKKWLFQNGPISIGINANALQFYVGGVSHPFRFLCSPDDLDHGMLIVGYGIHTYPIFEKALPFWIVKNSWGENWGEQGYYRVYRGDGTCGVNKMATSAVVP